MLIAQPLQPITNHVAFILACFTFIPSLPTFSLGDWGICAYIT
jgi:hypothetical protein